MPAAVGDELLAAAFAAFSDGMQVEALLSATVALLAAVFVTVFVRRLRADAPEESPALA